MEKADYFNAMKTLEGKVLPEKLCGCRKYYTMRDSFPVLEQNTRGPIAEKWVLW